MRTEGRRTTQFLSKTQNFHQTFRIFLLHFLTSPLLDNINQTLKMLRQTLRSKPVKILGTGAAVIFTIEYTTHLPSQGRSSQLYHRVADEIVTPFIRTVLNPEDAHNLAIKMTKEGWSPRHRPNVLEGSGRVNLSIKGPNGLVLPNCIGLAAGFDKDGVAIKGLMELGFGFVEIGSVTPKAQPGNPKPRMYRLVEDEGVINRFGFNSVGMEQVEQNLIGFRKGDTTVDSEKITVTSENGDATFQQKSMEILSMLGTTASKVWHFVFPKPPPFTPSILGVNLGKNKLSTHETEDYEHGIQKLGPYADYLVVNISSPNTPGLRNLQKSEPIRRLLQVAKQQRDSLKVTTKPPLFVKIAPDLTDAEMEDIANAAMDIGIDGILVTNTSNQRPEFLQSKNRNEVGGLSGKPIREMSTECIRKMYSLTGGKLFIIGIGGVGSGHDAYEKLKAGASAVQIYSRMVYEGPGLVSRIRKELAEIMVENGLKCVDEVVGLDHEEIYWNKRLEKAKIERENEVIIVSDDTQ